MWPVRAFNPEVLADVLVFADDSGRCLHRIHHTRTSHSVAPANNLHSMISRVALRAVAVVPEKFDQGSVVAVHHAHCWLCER